MKTIYLDSGFMCHLEEDGGRLPVETDVFDNVYNEAIPYYRYIPEGMEWTDEKGRTIYGTFIQATNSKMIDQIQREMSIADMQMALNILGVNP